MAEETSASRIVGFKELSAVSAFLLCLSVIIIYSMFFLKLRSKLFVKYPLPASGAIKTDVREKQVGKKLKRIRQKENETAANK